MNNLLYYIMQNLVYEWVDFQNFLKFEPKFAQIKENFGSRVIAQNLAQIGPIIDSVVYEWVVCATDQVTTT